MNRTVAIYASLLTIALLGAYFSWTYEATDEEKGVVLFDVDQDELKSVNYKAGDDFEITLEPRGDAYGEYIWAESTRIEKKKPPRNPHDPHAPAPPLAPDAPKETVTKSFKAGSSVDRTMTTLAPFRAIREIEKTGGRMKEFGLEDPEATLKIEGPSQTKTYHVGKAGYGHRNVYVRDSESGKVYLVDGRAIGALERGDDRLPERRLFDMNANDIEEAKINSGDESLTVVHKNRADRAKAYWSRAGSEEKDRAAAAWIRKLLRIRSTAYAPADFNASGLETALTVEVKLADGKTSRIELMRGQDEDSREQWYARSELTRGIVEVPLATASDLARDVNTVLTGEEPQGATAAPVPAAPEAEPRP